MAEYYTSINEYVFVLKNSLFPKIKLIQNNGDYKNASFYCEDMIILRIINKFTNESYTQIKINHLNYNVDCIIKHIICYKNIDRAFHTNYHIFPKYNYTGKVKYYHENGSLISENNFENGFII